jgi:hypothetical protein
MDEKRRLVKIGKLDLPHSVRKRAMDIGGDSAGEACLTDAAHSRQRQQASRG